MACNLPIVSVPVGDVAERLAGVAGCAIRPRDPAALGAALVQALRDGRRTTGRGVLQAMGLDQDTVARKILAIYEDVLARHHRGHGPTRDCDVSTRQAAVGQASRSGSTHADDG